MGEGVALPWTPEQVSAERARRRHLRDPVAWIQERLGDYVWSKQRTIAESVRDHRHTAVPSCHGAGKSFISARIGAWWLTNNPVGDAFLVTSASNFNQVRAVLWREINRAHGRGRLPGRVNQTEWHLQAPDGRWELVGLGRKPADMDVTGFQGIHARKVLVIFDEADGIPAPLWEGADSLLTNDDCRFLAIGNPVDPSSEFASACKPGSGWNVIGISAFETPNFTGEPVPDALRPLLVGKTWVEEKRRKWTETNPMWLSRVLGQFPEVASDGLIPASWVKAAQDRALLPGLPNRLGVDVGGGQDKNVIAHRRGPVVRIIARSQDPDTMRSCGVVIRHLKETGAEVANVDPIGIGKGIVDRGAELKSTGEVTVSLVGVDVRTKPNDPEQYLNKRAELYWGLRERFQAGDVDLDPDDDDLAAQLCALKWKPTSRGQVQIESKEDMRKRGLPSPDDADAVMLAFAEPPIAVSVVEEPDPTTPMTGGFDRTRLTGGIFSRPRG
jgi:hypothetical protein